MYMASQTILGTQATWGFVKMQIRIQPAWGGSAFLQSSQVMPWPLLCALNNKDVGERKCLENKCPVGLFYFFCSELFSRSCLPAHLALL